jgi:molybdopterin/thiamine biosynthesis adenylyltransferase/rhodanese-related sulfurtransferase
MTDASLLRRYSRHLVIPEVGLAGQRRLGGARVLCVGAGGLGTPVAAYLTAAGVGRIGIVDDDVVEESNLQRQILYTESDVGRPKAAVLAERLRAMNSTVSIDAIPLRLSAANARELIRLYDVVVDGTDSFSSRYLISDACALEDRPSVFGAIFRFTGQVIVFPGRSGPCYRCVYPNEPLPGSVPNCADGGVFGVLPGVIGTLQANEVLKLLLGIGRTLAGRLCVFNALEGSFQEISVARDARCALCGDDPQIFDVAHHDEPAHREFIEILPAELDDFLSTHTECKVLDLREPAERAFASFDSALVIAARDLQTRLHELDVMATYVVACNFGQQSVWALELLHEAGFKKLYHLAGGFTSYFAAMQNYGLG